VRREDRHMKEAVETGDAAQRRAERAAAALFARDRASQALGMRITGIGAGWARVVMTVRADMLNGHAVCHGGIVFALADSAFAFACNSHNENTLAAAASIDFLLAAREGDVLTAEARELWRGGRNGIYEINVFNQHGERIALFRGRSHRVDGEVVSGE
jgi:acyl-CoA thioesterase